MELQHINVKIPVEGDMNVDPERLIELFHRWVANQVTDELLIDIADYSHVPAGPGVVVIGLEADYSVDHSDGRYGLRYNRKAPLPGKNFDRFRQALHCAANACQLLESEFAADGLKFTRQGFELFINDRAIAPNTPETFADCRPELESFLTETLGHRDFKLEHNPDPRSRFGVTVSINKPWDFASIAKSPA